MGGRDEKVLDSSFPKFCNFIKENMKLVHLNMTSVGLPEKHMLELISNIKRSQSLHCVHLCGNLLSEQAVDHLNLKLKPTLINSMVSKEQSDAKELLLKRLKEKKYFE
jgi:hypothetical protein